MSTLFISDLHLDDTRPDLLLAFEQYCATTAKGADALYILGDLFEAWLGDDDDSVLSSRVAVVLRTLSDAGTRVYFQHGNRDFLLGDAYAARCGMTLLPEEHVIEVDGERVLLMHGDSLCTQDVAYQQFRKQARDPAWQRAMLSRSLAERRAFAQQARETSRMHTRDSAATIMDVDDDTVANVMLYHLVTRIVHGHTHRPAIHAFTIDLSIASRRVLPDW
jgi:UDP-2,3-diacylglucosamine hydrolase